MLNELNGLSIVCFQDLSLYEQDKDDLDRLASSGLWQWVSANHRHNILVWNEEDNARRKNVGAAEVAASKRLIDQYNQQRNDSIEAIDEAILSELGDVSLASNARLNSETPGSMIDRLSILALKIFHLREQVERLDGQTKIEIGRNRLERLLSQRQDLASCFDNLLKEAGEGRAYFKMYPQLKMFNNLSLSPYSYPKSGSGKRAS